MSNDIVREQTLILQYRTKFGSLIIIKVGSLKKQVTERRELHVSVKFYIS